MRDDDIEIVEWVLKMHAPDDLPNRKDFTSLVIRYVNDLPSIMKFPQFE